ncbi:hypothetical protein Tco_1412253 [Tanacetum coccineum]
MKAIREKANQTAQLIPKFQGIKRCNNYVVRQSIPCSPKCKIVREILLDHPLRYAMIATADVLAVYLQQFWKTVTKMPDTEDTIIFKLDNQEIVYTNDMFCNTLQLPIETLENSFVVPANIEIIKYFMNRVGYQGVVDKVSAFYMKFLAQPWQTMFKVFNRCLTTRTSGHDQTKINILQLFHAVVNRINADYTALLWWDFMNYVSHKKNVKIISIPLMIEVDYHSIKDDVPLEIRATNDFKEYEMVFVNVVVPMNQPQLIVSTQGMHRSTPRAHRTPTLTIASSQRKKRKQRAGETSSPRKPLKVTIRQKKQSTPSIPPPSDDKERDDIAKVTLLSLILHKTVLAVEAQENVSKVQENLAEEEIEKMVEGKEDEESYASEFADSMLNDDIDDSGTRIEPESYKENPEVVADEDVSKKKDDEKDEDKVNDDDVEKVDDAVLVNDNDDHTDHTLVGNHATGSMETRNAQM